LNKLTVMTRKLMAAQGPKMARALFKDAARGDRAAQQLVLRHLWPRSKVTDSVALDLPELRSAADVPPAIAKVAEAMAAGMLTPQEAASVTTVLNGYAQSAVYAGHEERLQALEAQLRGEDPDEMSGGVNGSWSGPRSHVGNVPY
jgi:hypothetical protein